MDLFNQIELIARFLKIKCDESRPDCGQCQEANVLCEYTEPKKRGPRKGYVQLLEERLAQMERKLMGPGVSNYNSNSNQHPHISDEENQSLSSTSNRAHSPIHLYENSGNLRQHCNMSNHNDI